MPIRVLVAAPRRSRRIAWVDIRSTTLVGEPIVPRGPLRVGCLSRAVVDAAVETFHADGMDWDATVEAGSDLSAVRVVVVGVTPAALARDPAAQLARIERAHAEAMRTGTRASVVATERRTIPLRRAG